MPSDRFRVLFDHAADAHLIFDDRGITDCNDATIRLLRARDRAQVLSLHPAVLSPPLQPDGRRSDEKSIEMDRLARERGWHRFEWTHRRLDGDDVPVEVTLSAVEIDGRPAMVVVWHDLTDRKRMEAELREANARMRGELEGAALVQQSMLPTTVPDVAGVHFAWHFRPSGLLAGDLLDVFRLDDRRVGFYVLDVTGHGAAASLLSVAVAHALSPRDGESFLRRAGGGFAEPFEVVRRLNRHFVARTPGRFFTICCGVLDVEERRLRYVTAGHPGPLLLPARGEPRDLNVPALPVGVLDDVAYEGAEVVLSPGDRVYAYSDGLTEARDAAGELYGEPRLVDVLRGASKRSLETSLARLEADVLRWTGPCGCQDDVSIVALEVEGKRPRPRRRSAARRVVR